LVVDVQPEASQVAVARHAVTDFLRAHDVPSVVVEDMQLVTSELVTNAVRHGRDGNVVVTVLSDEVVELTVSNVGPVEGIPPVEEWGPAPPTSSSGRGLGIVRRLSDHVEVIEVGDRTVVACRRRLPDRGGAS